jgi:transcriptional regulator with GAF, ATPase, and Fis domain
LEGIPMNVDENEFFRQVTLRICGSLNIEKALESCLFYMQRFIPLTEMILGIFEPDLNAARTIATVSIDSESEIGKIAPMPEVFREQSVANWAAMRRISTINRPESIPYHRGIYKKLGLDLNSSLMIMRLEIDESILGALALFTAGTDQYTDEHARLALLLHEPFAIAMANALKHREVFKLKEMLVDDNRYLHNQLRELSGTKIIGADSGLKPVMEKVRQVASLDSPVLLQGETGVGKDVIANAIHYSSPRKDGPFIKVNCGAIPEHLIDSELFGHEKGAFTGAIAQKRGRFERAHNGTVFLDEIGELPPQAQVRLLHVLQNKEIERVGGTKCIGVDIRIISATHRNLQQMVASQQFREDLWFRLNVFPIMIPPLRLRKEDIPSLVHYFIEKKTIELKLDMSPKLAPGAIETLQTYDWPGNVREVENVVERALIQNRDGFLSFDHHVTPQQANMALNNSLDQIAEFLKLDEVTATHILKALKFANGKISGPGGAAELLGIIPNTLRKRMDKLGISFRRQKKRGP